MSKRTLKIEVSYSYEIEIDDENNTVKEYENDKELVEHLASYRFSTLPVLYNGGVIIKDSDILETDFYQLK